MAFSLRFWNAGQVRAHESVTPGERIRESVPGDAPEIARVHAEAWQDAYRELVPERLLQRFGYDHRRPFWSALMTSKRPPLVAVAERNSDGAVIGFVWWRLVEEADSPFDAEIIAVAVRPGAQGRSLGRRLMAEAAGRLAESGASSAYLWVYRDNAKARRFYEDLAGRMVDSDLESHDGIEVPSVAYAWKPLSDLMEACRRAGSGKP